MPEGEIFRPAKGGLAPGTHQHHGGRGKSCRWSQSKDAPKWMSEQFVDKEALITPSHNGITGWGKVGYEREGMTGTVGDFTISGEGPAWLVDTMERVDPSLILRKQTNTHKTFGNHKGGDADGRGHMKCAGEFFSYEPTKPFYYKLLVLMLTGFLYLPLLLPFFLLSSFLCFFFFFFFFFFFSFL